MKVAVYSPYLDTFGGGERYMLTIAECLSKDNFVDLLFDSHLYSLGADDLKKNLGKRFDLDLSRVNVVKAPLGKASNTLERSIFLKKYDKLFYLTDGSIFYPTAKKNILHIQSPLAGQPSKSMWGKFKLNAWDLIIYNSEFTKVHSEKLWPIKSEVIYPPVDVKKIKKLTKKKYILSVGRFFGYLRDKKQDTLIKIFKELFQKGKIPGWSLHLVGSAGKADIEYLKELKDLSKELPIIFYPNLDFVSLVKLYGESTIYWHAAGYQEEDPVKMEHFGISTVEAMAAGCVPVVINQGGQTEIVDNDRTGFLWDSLKDLEKFTLKLIKDDNLRLNLSQNAISASRKFSKIRFEKKIIELIKNV